MLRIARLVALSCILATPAAAEDIKDLDQAWMKAMKDNDIAAVLALYAPDAVFFVPDAPQLKGSKAIGQYFSEFLTRFRVKDVRFMDTGSQTEDDLSVSWGRYAMVLEPKAGGPEEKFEGRFTGVAKKIDGKWRYISDHASMVFTPAR